MSETPFLVGHPGLEPGANGLRIQERNPPTLCFLNKNVGMSGTEQVTAGLQKTDSRHGAAYSRDELKHKIRRAVEAGVISDEHARTLDELIALIY